MIRETARTVTLPSGDVLTPADFERMADEVLTNPPEFAPVNPKGGRPSLVDGISPTLRVRIDETTRQRLADREQRTSFENSSNTGSPPNRNPDDDWDPNVLQPRLDKDTFTKLAPVQLVRYSRTAERRHTASPRPTPRLQQPLAHKRDMR